MSTLRATFSAATLVAIGLAGSASATTPLPAQVPHPPHYGTCTPHDVQVVGPNFIYVFHITNHCRRYLVRTIPLQQRNTALGRNDSPRPPR